MRGPSTTGVTDRLNENGLRWRVLGAAFALAGLLALVAGAGPHASPLEATIAVAALVAVLCGAVMIRFATRLPDGALLTTVALGVLAQCLAIGAVPDPTTPLALLFTWCGASASFFFPRRQAVALMLSVTVAYGVILALNARPETDEFGRWVMTAGTIGVLGALAGLLREYGVRMYVEATDAALRDTLTGALNRRGFEQALGVEVERAVRTGRPVSVAVIDLDGLAGLNLRAGRGDGDEAILRLLSLTRERTRRVDVIGRIGGDEVAVILPDADEFGALLMAERLRRSVRERGALAGAGLTASAGVATYPKHAGSSDSLVNAAEQALAGAKRLGRDRCVVYSAELSGTVVEGPAGGRGTEHLAAVLMLAETLDLRDAGTARHSLTVAEYAEAIARGLGLAPERVERVRVAGLLHDIGKVGVPDGILLKPGRLTDAEMDEIRKHPEIGARIISGANLDDIAEWVLAHHERPDGRGYPLGLSGEEIPLEARILSVADAFEAMTADRVYRSAMPLDAALDQLRQGEGAQFDPQVVAAFLATGAGGLVTLTETAS